MSNSEFILNVRNLSVRRGETTILKNITWQVRRGEHWVILGANGSGKTSLLAALTGYLMPTNGEISVLGRVYGESDWRDLRKEIGIVSSSVRQMMADDEPAFESIISGKHAMIDFRGRITTDDRTRARQILRRVRCSHLERRPWRVLSQGERQRILIGRALMANPRLLILDEPCAGLDPVAREHFLRFLEQLAHSENSPSLIYVTHHVEEITAGFSHVLLLRRGRVLAAGEKARMLTAALLSKTFENRLRVQRKNTRYAVTVKTDQSAVT